MIDLVKSGTTWRAPFYVNNSAGAAVTGLVNGDFTKKLTKDGAHDTTTVTVTEVDAVNQPGRYDATVTLTGGTRWALRVSNATYNPIGWFGEALIATRAIDDLAWPTTSGRSMDVDASGGVELGSVQAGAIGAAAFASGALDAVWSTTTRTLSAAGVQAIWDALTSALTTSGSIGKRLADDIDATISSRLASASYSSPPSAATIATAVWAALTGDNTTAGSFGKLLGLFANSLDATGRVRVGKWLDDTVSTLNASGYLNVNVEEWRSSLANALSSGNVQASVAAMQSAAVQAIWDALTSELTTSGSIGKRIVDNLDATVSSRLASASYTAPPSAGVVADAVWDEARSGHVAAGSFGEGVSVVSITAAAIGASQLAADALTAIADGLLDRASAIEAYTPRNALKFMAAVLAGTASGGPGTSTFNALGTSTPRVAVTADSDGDRSAVVLTP